MTNRKMQEHLLKMYEMIRKNKKLPKSIRAFPVVSTFLYKSGNEVTSFINSKADKLFNLKDNAATKTSHGEWLCLNDISDRKISIDEVSSAIITMPPCEPCFNKIIEETKIRAIYFLFDKNKLENEWIRDQNTIEFICVSDAFKVNQDEMDYMSKRLSEGKKASGFKTSIARGAKKQILKPALS